MRRPHAAERRRLSAEACRTQQAHVRHRRVGAAVQPLSGFYSLSPRAGQDEAHYFASQHLRRAVPFPDAQLFTGEKTFQFRTADASFLSSVACARAHSAIARRRMNRSTCRSEFHAAKIESCHCTFCSFCRPSFFITNAFSEMKLARDQILSEIRRVAAAGGQPPGSRTFERETGIGETHWRGVYWARWSDALREAGLAPNERYKKSDSELILEKFCDAARHYGRLPTAAELRMYRRAHADCPSEKTIHMHFGSKDDLLVHLRAWIEGKAAFDDIARMLGPQTDLSGRAAPHAAPEPRLSAALRPSLQDRPQRSHRTTSEGNPRRAAGAREPRAFDPHRRSRRHRGLLAPPLQGPPRQWRMVSALARRCRGVQAAEVSVEPARAHRAPSFRGAPKARTRQIPYPL